MTQMNQLGQDMGDQFELGHYLHRVRPVTSIAVAVLLGIIMIAFVFKLATGGLTP